MASAQLLIKARLSWVVGFPSSKQRWISVPLRRAAHSMVLDARALRRATFALGKLRGEQAALELLVDDAPSWLAAVEGVLAATKEMVHRGAPPLAHLLGRGLFPPRLERAIARLEPSPRRAAERLTWVYATEPGRLRRALAWLEAGGDHPDPVIAVQLAHLAASHGAEPLTALTRLLNCPTGLPLLAQSAVEPIVAALAKARPIPELVLPASPYDAALRVHLETLLALEPKAQRRALLLHEVTDLDAIIHAWGSWWLTTESLVAKAKRLQSSHEELVAVVQKALSIRRRLAAHTGAKPPATNVALCLDGILTIASSQPLTKATLRLAGATPPGLANRAGLLVHVGELHRASLSERRRKHLPHILNRCRRLLAVAGDEFANSWSAALRRHLEGSWGGSMVTDDLMSDEFPAARIDIAYDVLEGLADLDPGDGSAVAGCVVRVAAGLPEGLSSAELCSRTASITRVLHRIERHRDWMAKSTLAGLHAVDELELLPTLAEPLLTLHHDAPELDLAKLVATLLGAMGGHAMLFEALLLDSDRAHVTTLAQRLSLLGKLGKLGKLDPTPPASSAALADSSYPVALRPALSLLSESSPRAAAIASRLLRESLPTSDALERESAAIAARLDDGALLADSRRRLQKRFESLRKRIAEPAPLTEATLDKLRRKIIRRAARERTVQAAAAAREQLHAALGARLQIDELPDWVDNAHTLRVVDAALDLPKVKAVLWNLLRARATPPPWDLREAPANARFITARQAQGVDMAPWLDGLPPWSERGLTLGLESDPLLLFYMGEHFGTCLSIGACNFFSVFANAADINKRVLYAKNEAGHIVGRRLLCLSDSGVIVAFRTYCHDGSSTFFEASNRFITTLANAMGTTTAPRGRIASLVAQEWYDDGAVDVAHRFDFLEDDTPFRRGLATLAPESLADALFDATGSRGIDGILAPILAALPEVVDRPPLAIALVGLLREPESLPGDVAIRIGESLLRADAHDLARRLFAPAIEQHLERVQREHGWMPADGLDVLARVDAGRALRVLRRTRPRGVRRWADEHDPTRLLAAARALVALARPHQARPLLERLAANERGRHRAAQKLLAQLPPR